MMHSATSGPLPREILLIAAPVTRCNLGDLRLLSYDCSTGKCLCDYACRLDLTIYNEWHEFFSLEVLEDNVIAVLTVAGSHTPKLYIGVPTALIYRVDDDGLIEYRYTDRKNYHALAHDDNKDNLGTDLLLRSGLPIGWRQQDCGPQQCVLTTGCTQDDRTLYSTQVIDCQQPDIYAVGDYTVLLRGQGGITHDGSYDRVIVCNLQRDTTASSREDDDNACCWLQQQPLTVESWYEVGYRREVYWATRWTSDLFVVLYEESGRRYLGIHSTRAVGGETIHLPGPSTYISATCQARLIPHDKLLLLDSHAHKSYELCLNNDEEHYDGGVDTPSPVTLKPLRYTE